MIDAARLVTSSLHSNSFATEAHRARSKKQLNASQGISTLEKVRGRERKEKGTSILDVYSHRNPAVLKPSYQRLSSVWLLPYGREGHSMVLYLISA